MHGAIRAAGFSLMTMFVSCGVGAQDLDTRIGKIAMEGELPARTKAGAASIWYCHRVPSHRLTLASITSPSRKR